MIEPNPDAPVSNMFQTTMYDTPQTRGPDVSLTRRMKAPPLMESLDDKVRLFLVGWTAMLMFLVLIIFLITRDALVLLTTTVIGIAVTAVFSFYFKRKE